MNLNNYFKVEIPFKSKNYNKKDGDRYSGTAYFVFQKVFTKNNELVTKLVYQTLKVDKLSYGATNYADSYLSEDYLASKVELKEYRLQCFEKNSHSYLPTKKLLKKKPRTKFLGDLSTLNKLLEETKATLKDFDAFVSGSNSSGGLKKPKGDPIRMTKNSLNYKRGYDKWMIFSLLSNLEHKQNNSVLTFNFISIEKIKTIPIEEMLKDKTIKVVPYGMKGNSEVYVQIEEAFLSQNNEVFNSPTFNPFKDVNLYMVSLKEIENLKKEQEFSKRILNWLDCPKLSHEIIKNKLRQVWGINIRDNIKKYKFKKDFVLGVGYFERAHIVEQKNVKKILLNSQISKNKKEQELNDLFNKENYLLLTPDVHKYWDKNKIKISPQGEIIRNEKELSLDDFNKLTVSGKNIYQIYPNVKTQNREKLLLKRFNNNF